MPTRRELLAGLVGAGAAAVVAGCADTESSPTIPSPVSTSPLTTSPVTTAPVTTSPVTTSPVTTPVPSPGPAPWSGADFGELDRFLEAANTEAFRIVEGSQVIHEWYRTDETYGRDVASAQKSVLSLLVGRAIGEGLVTLDTAIDDVLGTGWTPHGRTAGITVRHLLAMTSGLDDQFAVVSEPGAHWRYSGAFAALFDVLTTATGKELNQVAAEWLFAPAGASTAQFYERRTAQFAPFGLFARASDLTSIGQTVLDATQPGLPDGRLDESFTSSQSTNPAYGYLWWLNGQSGFRLPGAAVTRPGTLIPGAPPDLVGALGKDDQKLYVSRELDLVVARLGDKSSPGTRPALSTFDAPLWELLLRLRTP
jgi:CubicO group peptidase (beta-lactamase class C family)